MYKNSFLLLAFFTLLLGFVYATTTHSTTFQESGPPQVVIMDDIDCMVYSPNPSADGIITVESINIEDIILAITVYDMNNTVQFSQTYHEHQVQADLSQLALGDYRIVVETNQGFTDRHCVVY